MQKNDEITIKIESLSGDGRTVAHHDGIVVFVSNAVPGDDVRAKIWKKKKNFAEARTIEILEPSQNRVVPKCKHFGVCGGCSWQNLSYEAQIKFKRERVSDAFRHIGKFENPEVLETIGCGDPYFYRNKMEFTFSNYRWLTSEEMDQIENQTSETALGLHIPQRYDKVLNIEECFLQSNLSTAILNSVRDFCIAGNLSAYSTKTHEGYLRHLVIRDGKRTDEIMVNIVTTFDQPDIMQEIVKKLMEKFPQITTIVNNITDRKSMVAFGDTENIYRGPGYINEKLGSYLFRISANSFFQTNTLQAEKLYEIVKRFAQLKPNDVVYDLYCGTGTIALYLSDTASNVIGIDLIESAIKDANLNAEQNKVLNCSFLQGDLKDILTKENKHLLDNPKPDVIVADPPRSGIHPKVIEQIIKISPERIVYVSCNPATQARDAEQLTQGGYELKIVQPVDMFPHTDHIEAVALFLKK